MLWLQLHLCKRKGTLVVVSHDQEFLNVVCNNIIHVHDRKLAMYVCVYWYVCIMLCFYVPTRHVLDTSAGIVGPSTPFAIRSSRRTPEHPFPSHPFGFTRRQ